MPRYSEERRNAVLSKLLPPNNQRLGPRAASLTVSACGVRQKEKFLNLHTVMFILYT